MKTIPQIEQDFHKENMMFKKEKCNHAIGMIESVDTSEYQGIIFVYDTETYLKNDLDVEFNFCPNCGEKIRWQINNAENGNDIIWIYVGNDFSADTTK